MLRSRRCIAVAIAVVVLGCLSWTGLGAAAEADSTVVNPVPEVLLLGPVSTPLPAFHAEKPGGFAPQDLLSGAFWAADARAPRADDTVPGPEGALTWERRATVAGELSLDPVGDTPQVARIVFYLSADRHQEVTLRITSAQPLRLFQGGREVKLVDADSVHTAKLTLPPDEHLIALHTVWDPDRQDDDVDPDDDTDPDSDADSASDESWRLSLEILTGEDAPAATLAIKATPERRLDIGTVLDAPRVSDVRISPDGKLAAITLRAHRPGGAREQWLEVRGLEDAALTYSRRGGSAPAQLRWLPTGRQLSFTTASEGKTTLWRHDLEAGQTDALLREVEHFGGYQWAPDASFVIYSVSDEVEADERKVKRVKHPADRQPWWRNGSHLMQAFLPSGLTRQLTAGPIDPGSWRITPDGKRLLFFQSEPQLDQRPYSTSVLWELDLATLTAVKILNDPWIRDAIPGPDPDLLLLHGSPSAFDGLGRNLPEGVQANDYGGQLYLYARASGEARTITGSFTPAVAAAAWSLADDRIYAECTDRQYRQVYVYDPDDGEWQRIEAGLGYVRGLDLARDKRQAVVWGSDATTPNRVHAVDLKRNRQRLLLDPGAEDYRDVLFGESEAWVCTLPDGEELDGRIYYPPGFNDKGNYPLIVYFYGGTSPVTVDFGGRYPKNIWAGQGYVVYVPEPSGATGYGQAFAAKHVNDWGQRTAWEVIEATQAFLAAHAFADPERVGCIGASYGGFLTQYILTRTDIFAAGVSHAGISSISSYWGEGLWGYLYGARALANSFPWQDRELFIEQSPLFHAEKITTPLLLLHGDSDVNVPVGESDQLFTALKLLGRDVEYVQIQGQDHHILDHDQRIVWNDTILAYFARYLRNDPGWWEALFPAEDE